MKKKEGKIMKIHDIHKEQEKVVLLLHPMLANAQMMRNFWPTQWATIIGI